MNHYIKPDWPAPKNVKAYSTTRNGGVSKPPYDSFNFSLLAGDDPNDVLTNRNQLSQELNLPQEPSWLKQEHSNLAIRLEENSKPEVTADASFTTIARPVCVVRAADCVPILVCDINGTIVAAIHAGWKGLASGIIENTVNKMDLDPTNLIAWLGPAIGPNTFKVGPELQELFCQKLALNKSAFVEYEDRFLANIYMLASIQLKQSGVTKIYGGDYCTYTQKELFYSFRRDGEKSGRMATLIWLEK